MKPYTVIFYIDAEYAVETFVEHVTAASPSEAFDVAVAQVKEDGGTTSGRSLSEDAYELATEIVTFDGHMAPSTN